MPEATSNCHDLEQQGLQASRIQGCGSTPYKLQNSSPPPALPAIYNSAEVWQYLKDMKTPFQSSPFLVTPNTVFLLEFGSE